MNLLKPSLALTLLCQPCLAELFPNGDFEAGGDEWVDASGGEGSNFSFDYPATGGNPDGHGIINDVAGTGYGILIGGDQTPLSLASLGLTAGEAYDFTQDMKILSGSKIGGFKLDWFNGSAGAGSSGEKFPQLIGDGSTWETYTFNIAIPLGVDGVKVVPLWGAGSSVGFDNIGFNTTGNVTPVVPNGFFEEGGASWLELGLGASFAYPATGGNPDGHGRIVSTTETGFWTAAGGAPIGLGALGVAPGDTATFKQDMKIFEGTAIGGMRLEFFSGNAVVLNTGDMRPALIGDGSTWETYEFEVTVPANAESVKMIIMGTTGSTVDFDNVIVGEGVPPPPNPDNIASPSELVFGTLFNWSGSNPNNFFQPQISKDEATWTNLGPAFTGSAIGQAFDPSNAKFSRVLEAPAVSGEAILNGGFEENDSGIPNSWTGISGTGQEPQVTTTDAFEGSNSLRIAAQNDTTPTPNQSEIQYNVAASGGSITPGETYDFSFQAKQISSGVSYVQNYRVQWLNSEGAVVQEAFGFTPFAGGDGTWVEIKRTGLIAPAETVTALIQIFGATGAVASVNAKGEVLIDNISLEGEAGLGAGTVLATSGQETGVGIEFSTVDGLTYQAQIGYTMEDFDNLGPAFEGNGGRAAVGIQYDEDFTFFRFLESQ